MSQNEDEKDNPILRSNKEIDVEESEEIVEAAIHINIGKQKLVLNFEELVALREKIEMIFSLTEDRSYEDELARALQQPLGAWGTTTTTTGGTQAWVDQTTGLPTNAYGWDIIGPGTAGHADVVITSTSDTFTELKNMTKVNT